MANKGSYLNHSYKFRTNCDRSVRSGRPFLIRQVMPGHEIKSKIIVLNWGHCYELSHGGGGGSKARLGCRSVHAKRLNNHEDPWKDVNPIYAKHQCCVLLCCCCFQIQRTRRKYTHRHISFVSQKGGKGVNQDSVRQRTTKVSWEQSQISVSSVTHHHWELPQVNTVPNLTFNSVTWHDLPHEYS